MFYQVVAHSVLLFGAETWVLPEAMSRKMEGLHVGLLRHIKKQRAVQQLNRTWWQVVEEKVLDKADIQSLGTYI